MRDGPLLGLLGPPSPSARLAAAARTPGPRLRALGGRAGASRAPCGYLPPQPAPLPLRLLHLCARPSLPARQGERYFYP